MTKKSILPIVLIGGGIAAAIYYATNKAAAAGKLSFKNPKFTKFDVGLMAININVTLEAVNPSTTDLPFDYYYGTLSNGTTKICDFKFTGSANNSLKGQSTTVLPFQITVPTLGLSLKLLEVFKAIGTGKAVDSIFSVNSAVFAAGREWPVNFAYDVKTQSSVSGIGFLTHFILKKIKAMRKKRKARNRGRVSDNVAEDVREMDALHNLAGMDEIEGYENHNEPISGIGLIEHILLRKFIKSRKKKKAARRAAQQAAAAVVPLNPTAIQPGMFTNLTPEQRAQRRAYHIQRKQARWNAMRANGGVLPAGYMPPPPPPGYTSLPGYTPAPFTPGGYPYAVAPVNNFPQATNYYNPQATSYYNPAAARPANTPFYGN